MDTNKSLSSTVVTAVGQDDLEKKKKKHPRSGKKKRQVQQRAADLFEIPGVKKLAISPETQEFLGCIVGEHVTGEKPWKYIPKDAIEDHLDLHEEDSEFLQVKDYVIPFPKDEILVGYVPDEAREYDEFYICVTPVAQEKVEAIIDSLQKEMEARLHNAINKTLRPWVSLGSEIEVEDEIIRNNRPLYEVEIESEYPIMSSKVHFKLTPVEDIQFSYAELTIPSWKPPINNVFRKRVDASVQVTAPVKTTDVQTVCTYPQNVYTQYEYECAIDAAPSETCAENIRSYVTEHIEKISDFLNVNGRINFYENDYKDMYVPDEVDVNYEMSDWKEFMSFNDINLCKDKMISGVSWHPMLTGTVAIAYADVAPNVYRTGPSNIDEVNRIVHGINPVLIWSFLDGLNPKLLLEAHREVVALSFCPYDENILVGGCSNGQVIIWDIRNKFKHVETEEILTSDQKTYRTIMHSLMKWMRNIHDLKIVKIAAVSDVVFSHKDAVTRIQWISPFWEVSKTGQIEGIPEESGKTSLQFMTSSTDGSTQIWDLLARPTLAPGSYRPQRRLKRLKRRPSALTVDASPYKILNRIFKPVFKVNITLPQEGERSLALTNLYVKGTDVDYVEEDPNSKRKPSLIERIRFKPIFQFPRTQPTPKFTAGSPEGDFFIASWEGYEYNTGEIVNEQNCSFESFGKYHDGPITAISGANDHNLILTVGGKVFAIWHERFKNRPVFWRKSCVKYTQGCWKLGGTSLIKLARADGNIEFWYLLNQTDTFTKEQNTSGDVVTGSHMHPPRNMKRSVMGIADANGSFRIFINKPPSEICAEKEKHELLAFFEREVIRKNEFVQWQKEWVEKHSSEIRKRYDQVMAERLRKQKKEEEIRQKLEEERARLEKSSSITKQVRPPPGQYKEWATDQWCRKEEEILSKILLEKKRLNKDLLEKQHQPIKRYEDDKKKKKVKQEERQGEAQNIFNETVAMLFPDAIKKKIPPPPDPYAGGDSVESKRVHYEAFTELVAEMDEFVEDHPFAYKFDWKFVIGAGRQRRKLLDASQPRATHTHRHEDYKYSRKIAEEAQQVTFAMKRAEEITADAADTLETDTLLDGETNKTEEKPDDEYGILFSA